MTDSGQSIGVGTRVRAANGSAVHGTVHHLDGDGNRAFVDWDNGASGWHSVRSLVVL
jgi:hypothetical protein